MSMIRVSGFRLAHRQRATKWNDRGLEYISRGWKRERQVNEFCAALQAAVNYSPAVERAAERAATGKQSLCWAV